jgi:hypothetical protein
MRTSGLARALSWFGAAVAFAAALAHVALLAWIVAGRIGYPLDLEWMEGGMLCHALRLMQGDSIYAAPSVDFISYLYTPFYPMVLAALGKLFGLSYMLGRIVSLLSFAGACAIAVLAVRRHALGQPRGLIWGVVSVGLIASAFPHTEAWYDLVRNDSLFLLLTAGALYLLIYRHRSWNAVGLAGLSMGLAFLTKQTAAVFVLASGALLLWLRASRLLLYVPTVGAIAGGGVLWLNARSDGWFWRYIYEMHQGHKFYPERLWPKTELALLELWPVVAGLIGLWLITVLVHRLLDRRRPSPQSKEAWCWLFLALVGVFVAALGFSTQWAEENAYIPAFYFGGLFAGIAVLDLRRRIGQRPLALGIGTLVVGGALAAQLVAGLYSPKEHLMSAGDRQAARDLLALLGHLPGRLLVPYHPFYPHLVARETHYHQMGINDVTRAGYPMPRGINQRFAQQYYDWIVLDTPPGARYAGALRRYKLWRYLEPGQSPGVVTGFRVRPKYVLQRQQPDPAPEGGRRVFGFEDGSYRNWERKGRAFGTRPVGGRRGNQALAGPYEGQYLASSRVYGDGQTGRLLSPEFTLDGPRLSYRIGGGKAPGTIELRLLLDGQPVHRATGTGKHVLEVRELDVSRFQGQKMRIELVDHGSAFRHYILFDDLIVWKEARAPAASGISGAKQ